MLETLPDAVGHALSGQHAGLDKTAFRRIDLRAGMGAIEVRSLAFADHAPIPAQYSADGAGISPPLQWVGVPSAAASLLLIVEDADAPTPQPLVHAIVVGLPAQDGALAEGALDRAGREDAGFRLGLNSYLQPAWMALDPPPGHGVHRYAFQLFALQAGAEFSAVPGRDEVVETLGAHAIASGCLIGTYERPDGSIREPGAEPAMASATTGGMPAAAA